MGLGKMTDFTVMLIVTTTLVLIFSPSAYSQSDNLGDILGAPASSYSSFYSLLESSTGTSRILQDQADTQQGLTLFVPNNNAIATDPVPWGTLSVAQIQSLILFHAVPQYYGISALNTLSQLSPVVTMAGGQYTLNFTVVSQALYLNSGWTSAKVVDVVKLNTSTLQIYQIDAVLKPEAIFGTNIPPPPSTATATPSSSAPPPPTTATPATPTSSTPSAPPPPPTSSTPTTTITIAHSVASLLIVGLGGWSGIVLGV
ncbi:fasciclin-like arabinogalactan protein 7 [Rhododendron vialii]|uniref:fasciclin-like arabinogalactan protein 7 n=1 Tax=Rhododendron vialii TaxID=182163 RepID=UPI00265DECBB|nr:fasciclin-like arabinogalactan protein 7 [Rhododendron vialii]